MKRLLLSAVVFAALGTSSSFAGDVRISIDASDLADPEALNERIRIAVVRACDRHESAIPISYAEACELDLTRQLQAKVEQIRSEEAQRKGP